MRRDFYKTESTKRVGKDSNMVDFCVRSRSPVQVTTLSLPRMWPFSRPLVYLFSSYLHESWIDTASRIKNREYGSTEELEELVVTAGEVNCILQDTHDLNVQHTRLERYV